MEFFFWPLMITSLILSIWGIIKERPIALVVSSIIILPLALYLAATPRFEVWGLIFPFFFVGASFALAKKQRWVSTILILPNFIVVGWIGASVLTQ